MKKQVIERNLASGVAQWRTQWPSEPGLWVPVPPLSGHMLAILVCVYVCVLSPKIAVRTESASSRESLHPRVCRYSGSKHICIYFIIDPVTQCSDFHFNHNLAYPFSSDILELL